MSSVKDDNNSSVVDDTNSKGLVVGIDLGTTNTCMARIADDGSGQVIQLSTESITLPTIISIKSKDIFEIGKPSPKMEAKQPKNIITEIKRLIGIRYDDPRIQKDKEHWTFKVVGDKDGKALVQVVVDEEVVEYEPEFLLSKVIEHLVVVATKEYSAPIKGAVFTVPAYFDAVQKAGIRKAAEYANVIVKDIIHEPEAAVVSLGEMASPNGETRVVAVVDFGGGTFDVSVVRCYRNKSFGVVTTDGDPHLGGKDIDIALMEYVVAKMKKAKPDGIEDWVVEKGTNEGDKACLKLKKTNKGDKSSLKRDLMKQCELAKINLSTHISTEIYIEDFVDVIITRSELDVIAKPVLEQAINATKRAFSAAHKWIRDEPICDIVMVGGTTNWPLMQTMLKKQFPASNVVAGPEREYSVAKGAALWANKEMNQVSMTNCVVMNIGVEEAGGGMAVILHAGDKLPASNWQWCTNVVAHQKDLFVQIYEGNSPLAKKNRKIAECTLDELHGQDFCKCKLVMKMTLQGQLIAWVQDVATGVLAQANVNIKLGSEANFDYVVDNSEADQLELERGGELVQFEADLKAMMGKLDELFDENKMNSQKFEDWQMKIVRYQSYVAQQLKENPVVAPKKEVKKKGMKTAKVVKADSDDSDEDMPTGRDEMETINQKRTHFVEAFAKMSKEVLGSTGKKAKK